jgi:hypothetical protein
MGRNELNLVIQIHGGVSAATKITLEYLTLQALGFFS